MGAGDAGVASGEESKTSGGLSDSFDFWNCGGAVAFEAERAANLGTGRLEAAGDAENVAPAYRRESSFAGVGSSPLPLETGRFFWALVVCGCAWPW